MARQSKAAIKPRPLAARQQPQADPEVLAQFPVRSEEELSTDWVPIAVAGVALRWVTRKNMQKWVDQGLIPVKKGSRIVVNDTFAATDAEGIIRLGDLFLFAERVENKENRIAAWQRREKARVAQKVALDDQVVGEAPLETRQSDRVYEGNIDGKPLPEVSSHKGSAPVEQASIEGTTDGLPAPVDTPDLNYGD